MRFLEPLECPEKESIFSPTVGAEKGGILSEAEHSRRFAEDLLHDGKTYLRREENDFRFWEKFLGHPDCFLDEGNYNLENGEHFLAAAETFLGDAEMFRSDSEMFLSDAEMFLSHSEMFLNDSEMFLNRPSL